MLKSRKAGITIEISLSIILILGVLFVALGIFHDNLKNMVAASGMQNMFSKSNSSGKTTYSMWTKNPTSTQINVAMVGDQGLEAYHNQAKETIDALVEKSKHTSLTSQDITNLAQALTVLSESGTSAPDSELKPYAEIKNNNEITIYIDNEDASNSYTSYSGKTILWGEKINPAVNYNSLESKRISNVIAIKNSF